MLFTNARTYAKNEVTSWPVPNAWDFIALILISGLLCVLGWGAKSMMGHFEVGQSISISLSPWALPYYALRTVIRMLIALCFSLLCTFIFGTWAAKSRRAECIIIPMVDILQSVPVLGFLTITIVGFITLFHGSLLGPECAAIFVIFTAQAWNMILSFYQSVKTVPHDLDEAALMFRLSGWQRFWRIDVPFALPGLIWNMMMSMSGSWVFLVASEAISVANHTITLPGIGSYIAKAIDQANIHAIFYVIAAMLIVIALYDQLLFRPLVAWAEKFKMQSAASEIEPESWVLNLFQRTHWFRYVGDKLSYLADAMMLLSIAPPSHKQSNLTTPHWLSRTFSILGSSLLILSVLFAIYFLGHFIIDNLTSHEALHVLYLGLVTALRVTVLIVISSIIWVPIGVWVGLSPRASQIIQPIAQFFAAFPANLLFPVFVIGIVRYHLNVNIWTSPLMILGTQWYILFNVIAGTAALPKNLHDAVGTLGVTGTLWWRRFILPGIFPYYVTGAITAAGGAWNISIIAEAVSWGHTQLYATGLGAYITRVSAAGDFPHLTWAIVVMSLYVLTINRFMWKPLYNIAKKRFQIR